MNFEKNHTKLNVAQKKAVDHIDGPLMVIAGPGTGKTQLLSMRVANILRKTDADARNILCLTFTESGAANMTTRMAQLFGPEAYRVAVHTFHSFGAEIINRFGQYFYDGALFRAADDLTAGEVLEEILESLPHSSPLTSRMNGQYTYLNDLSQTISALKKSGLTPDELQKVLDQNMKFCEFATPVLDEIFGDRISKKTISAAAQALSRIEEYDETELDFTTEPPLSELITKSLNRTLESAESTDRTKPLTEWKRDWLRKTDNGRIVLADQLATEKLTEVAKIYDEYLREMSTRALYDFDDMILRVTHALEIFNELKYDLQEQFQYILVDEFQDTNDVQMRLLRVLTDYDPRPNIMVVGDDDQAIFRFQGADISNIQSFTHSYDDVTKIVLGENYRSTAPILNVAGQVVAQAEQRLATIENVDKTLNTNVPETDTKVEKIITETAESEYAHVVKSIAAQIANGANPESIAVIARRHVDLVQLLPFLNAQNIAVEYEREQDVLSSPPIEQLEILTRVVHYLAAEMHTEADELLPRILAHPAWDVTPRQIWELSLEAKAKRKYWLEIMLTFNDRTAAIAEWLIVTATRAQHEDLEIILDELFGREIQIADDVDEEPFADIKPDFVSPLHDYFFSKEKLAKNPTAYLEYLSALTTLRQKLREYRPDRRLILEDLIILLDTYRDLGRTIRFSQNLQTGNRVKLLTAHKAKGLEFDTVYVINSTSQNWGDKSRSRGSLIKFPHNMPFAMSGDNDDERIRLLFVALTRAKRQLIVTAHRTDNSGRALLPVEYLLVKGIAESELSTDDVAQIAQNIEIAWHAPIVAAADDLRNMLSETLAHYKLSATHLNNFVDVAEGGPTKWLLQNLLRFPQAKSAAAAFGTAIHTTLQRAHIHLSARGSNKPLEDLIGDFQTILANETLSDRDFEFYQQKGIDALTTFYKQRIDSFAPEQIVERSFASENIIIDEARLSGAIDLIDVDRDNKIIRVTDYKTGKAARSWQGRTDYEKIKLRKYRQQLMFYKLLLENSREFTNYTVTTGVLEFVEPLNDQIIRLEMTYDDAEMREFRRLIAAIWSRIQSLDLPAVDEFSPDFAGMVQFEQSLLS